MTEGIRHGHLTLSFPDNSHLTFGEANSSPKGTMVIKDWRVIAAVAAKGDIGFGETYMDGLWDTPDLEPLLQVFIANVDTIGKYGYGFAVQKFIECMDDFILDIGKVLGALGSLAIAQQAPLRFGSARVQIFLQNANQRRAQLHEVRA